MAKFFQITLLLWFSCQLVPAQSPATENKTACLARAFYSYVDVPQKKFVSVPLSNGAYKGKIEISRLPAGLRLSDSWVGYELRAEIAATSSKKSRIEGIILDDGKILHPSTFSGVSGFGYGGGGKRSFHVLNTQTGKIDKIENFLSLKIRKSAGDIDHLPGPGFLENHILEHGPQMALVRIREKPGADPVFIAGMLSRQDLGDGYWVFAIKDSKGQEHLLDPKLLADDYQSFLLPWRDRAHATNAANFLAAVPGPSSRLQMITALHGQKRALVREAVESGEFWFDKSFDTYLIRNPDQINALMRRWYPEKLASYPSILNKELGSNFVHLALDPRILSRWDKFLDFARDFLKKNAGATASNLRDDFARSLKRSKVFRGMGFNSPEIPTALQKNGIRAPGLAYSDRAKLEEMLFRELEASEPNAFVRAEHAQGLWNDIVARQRGDQLNASFTMSASHYMETAASVGYAYTSGPFKKGAKLYLFEIEMPEFNIIRRTGALSEKTTKKNYYFGEKMIEGSDPGLEVFIPYEIKSDWIKAVHEYKDPPPEWKIVPE